MIAILWCAAAAITLSAAGPADATGAAAAWDLGELRVGELRSVAIPLDVPEGATRAIKTVDSSCSCLQVLGFPLVARAGDVVQARYLALGEGTIAASVLVEFEGDENLPVEHRFTGSIRAGDRTRAIRMAAIDGSLFKHGDADLPSGFLIHASEARVMLERMPILVDVRSSADRTREPIEGALAMSLHELARFPRFAGQKVIMVGAILPNAEALASARALLQSGVESVHFVEGGAAAWHAAAKGAPVSIMAVPSEIHAAADRRRALFVDLSGEEGSSIYLPESVQLPVPADNGVVLGEALARVEAAHPTRRIVLVARDREAQQSLSSHFGDRSLWFLDGGLAEYREFLAQQTQLMQARLDRRNVVTQRSGHSASTSGHPLSGTPCGSCPGLR